MRPPDPVQLVAVEGGRDLSRFLRVPWSVYDSSSRWIPPLLLERRLHLSKRSNPYFQHAEAKYWIALRDGRPVGRISAQVDRLHLERYQDATGQFGMFEAVDDEAVFAALFGAAEGWLRERGMRRVIGPFSLSINDECGVLIDGFDTPPMFMMPHGYPYYDRRIAEQGYRKAKDTVAYLMDPASPSPPIVDATLARIGRGRIEVRAVTLSSIAADLKVIGGIFNDGWSRNWGFVPFTPAELEDLGRNLRLFVPPGLVQIASVDGQPAGMVVALPNLNEAMADLDGRLLPFGALRLLWRLRVRHPKSARIALMGICRAHQRSLVGLGVAFALVEALRHELVRRGVQRLEISWVLEDNRPARHVAEHIGARVYKTYRIYEKALA